MLQMQRRGPPACAKSMRKRGAFVKYYISVDGGGTKIKAILFDGKLNLISSVVSGSVNPNFSSQEMIQNNIEQCFTALLQGLNLCEIACLYVSTVGSVKQVAETLRKYILVNAVDDIGEYPLGLYAACLQKEAVIAISGTGSGVFHVRGKNSGYGVGGWGALISEEGSGYYLGRLAAMAAIRAYEKRGAPTVMMELIMKHFGYDDFRKALFSIYDGESQVRSIASLAYVVREAACLNDRAALKILRENGRLMADQTKAVLRNADIPANVPIRVMGGGFQSHIAMYNAYKENILREFPDRDIQPVTFEPVAGNVVRHICLKKRRLDAESLKRVKINFAQFLYQIIS